MKPGTSFGVLAVLVLTHGWTLMAGDYAWIGGSGNWSDPSKWLPAGVPGEGDSAQIGGGSVTIDVPVTVTNLTFGGGTIQGASPLTVAGMMSWTGGRMSHGETTIGAGGQLWITGGAQKELEGRDLINHGAVHWQDGGTIRAWYGAQLRNESDGSLWVGGGGTFQGDS